MSCQGISVDDCSILGTGRLADISQYIYDPETPLPEIGIEILPPNLQTLIEGCDDNTNCKLVSYDFETNQGTTASSSAYILQLGVSSLSPTKTNVSVLSNVGTEDSTSKGIPLSSLDIHYDPNHLLSTPPIANQPIGFSTLDGLFVSGSGTTLNGTTVDECANSCANLGTCKAFNFDESSSTCKYFPIGEVEAMVGQATLDNSNTQTNLSLVLKNPISNMSPNQNIEGLDEYVNGTTTIKTVTDSTHITIQFPEQAIRGIPENTVFTIKTGLVSSEGTSKHGYIYNIDRINNTGVSGTEDYGYNGTFKFMAFNGLPTTTTSTIAATPFYTTGGTSINYNYITQLTLNVPSFPKSRFVGQGSSGFVSDGPRLPITATSGLNVMLASPDVKFNYLLGKDENGSYSSKGTQTRAQCETLCKNDGRCRGIVSWTNSSSTGSCWLFDTFDGIYDRSISVIGYKTFYCDSTNTTDSKCNFTMIVQSSTTNSITFKLPANSSLPFGVSAGSALTNLRAIEVTLPLHVDSPRPSNRIIGWTGTMNGISGTVTVIGFTNTTITFAIEPQTYTGNSSVQDVTLSDSKGSTCRDIKACNASIQRLLDTSGIRSFSTLDLDACEACSERIYKKPIITQTDTQYTKVREFLWYENAGRFSCGSTPPPAGTTFGADCNPQCEKPDDALIDTVAYDSTSQTCQITCRPGFQWDGTACVPI